MDQAGKPFTKIGGGSMKREFGGTEKKVWNPV